MTIDEKTVLEVWNKGSVVQSFDPKLWRKDECGAWINFSKYGDRKSNPILLFMLCVQYHEKSQNRTRSEYRI